VRGYLKGGKEEKEPTEYLRRINEERWLVELVELFLDGVVVDVSVSGVLGPLVDFLLVGLRMEVAVVVLEGQSSNCPDDQNCR